MATGSLALGHCGASLDTSEELRRGLWGAQSAREPKVKGGVEEGVLGCCPRMGEFLHW